ncbi:MAG: hypothetical protein LAT51_06330 [Flavobacteriaceae bacterium]|nr:hypothetical protein [Flavobacteriaceae bacterium]
MFNHLILILASSLGAVATYLLHKNGLSVVVASCLIGLLGALLGHFFNLPHLALVIFAGTFVGMTSVNVGSLGLVTLGGLVCGIIYILSLKLFVGFGGKLGTTAFLSTLVVWGLFYLMNKFWG